MARPMAFRPHGASVRGANLQRNSLSFEGAFGRMFRALPPADFGQTDAASMRALDKLATMMLADSDPPKDAPDDEEGGIPSAYTYLGQFIDHDLTFDPASSLQRQNDPDGLVDFRTPRFDLDNVYGRGPDDQPYLYENGRRFLLGRPLTGAAANPNARDVPRNSAKPARAIIGDPRNDENVIVSQLQGLFLRFHNRIADENPDWSFAQVQREVRFHYQWMVLYDFLPTIIAPEVLSAVLPHLSSGGNITTTPPSLAFYHWKNEPFMPLEFSAAAYRFGHSMVRPGYRLSENISPLPIFLPDESVMSLRGFRDFPPTWALDWNLFIDVQPRSATDPTRLQLAYKIDTSLVNPLGNLPPSVAVEPNILALRNLLRGWRMRLPSGQTVARAMGIEPLTDDEIKIGKFTGQSGDIRGAIGEIPEFKSNCPLWVYVLAETRESDVVVSTTDGPKPIKTRRLGPVGGRIVAETFVGILLGDSSSFIAQDPLWKPTMGADCRFTLRDFVKAALQDPTT